RVRTQHADLATGPGPEALEDLDRGGLARTVRPEQSDDLPPVHVELDTVEHVGGAVTHAQVAHADHRLAHGSLHLVHRTRCSTSTITRTVKPSGPARPARSGGESGYDGAGRRDGGQVRGTVRPATRRSRRTPQG